MNKIFSLKDRARWFLLRKMHKGYLKALQQEQSIGTESYLQDIDTLISREDVRGEGKIAENLPLLITGDAYSGKSSLIAKWIRNHKNSHKTDNDYFIIRFAKLSPNDTSYTSLLYSIYNQIRVNIYIGILSIASKSRNNWR